MKKLDMILIAIFMIFIIVIIVLLFFYKSEAGQCLKDPLGYAQEKLGNNSYCSCMQTLENFKQVNYCASKCPKCSVPEK